MAIDPNLLNVTLSVVANGLTSLLATTGRKAEKLVIGSEFLDKWELEKTSLDPILRKAIVAVAEHGTWKSPGREEVVSLFLRTPEVEDIVRQIYSTKLIYPKDRDNLSAIRKIFLALLTQFVAAYPSETELKEDHLEDAANQLLDALIQGCDLLLGNAINKGILSAHEATSSFRQNVLLSEIKAIQKKLDFLTSQGQINVPAILEFEKKYRQQVGNRHGYITPPNLDTARPLPIDTLYVYPSFATAPKKGETFETLKRDEFLSRIHRAVLLGNPGAGKSTLTLKLCYDLATCYSKRLFAGRKELTPILIILRNYGSDKKDRKCSIRDFIEAEVKVRYQISDLPKNAFEYLLLNGRAIVIFDGLDELLDTSYRQEIRDDVQSFCNLYPSVPILVTSREVGYEQAPLNEKMFEVFRLHSFDDEQVQEYVKKWFTIADAADLTEKQNQTRIEGFLKDSQIVPDLRSNPLMLALLCNIYRQENYIPRYRPDVYEKCAIMLFERWDRNRKLYTPPLPEEHVRPLLEYLANWIYEDKQLRTGVTEEELTIKATEYLQEWLYENIYKAEKTARDFIEFCTGRAWVFTDTGTKKDGEKLYQFAHATFLEYFAAAHLVRVCRTPDALITVLSPRIARREWDVMAQLAFQLQSKKSVGAADELLTSLVNQSRGNKKDAGWNLLSFAVRCLQFMVPRPRVRREITEASVERCLKLGNEKILSRYFELDDQDVPREVLGNLLGATTENYITIAEALEKALEEHINHDIKFDTFLALEIGLELPYLSSYYNYPEERQGFWENVSNHLFDTCFNQIEKIGPKSLLLCRNAALQKKLPIAKLVQWHGVKSIFLDYDFTMFPDVGYPSLFRMLMPTILYAADIEDEFDDITDLLPILREIGNILPSCPTPWVDKQDVDWSEDSIYFIEDREMLNLDPEAFFGAFVLYAVWLESQNLSKQPKILNEIEQVTNDFFNSNHWMLLARFEPAVINRVQAEMDKCRFTNEQQNFIWRWIRKEVNLVK